jgi:hypothetical protein
MLLALQNTAQGGEAIRLRSGLLWEQAVHLARVLLAATQEWDEINVTARRLQKRATDGTFSLRVTSGTESLEED